MLQERTEYHQTADGLVCVCCRSAVKVRGGDERAIDGPVHHLSPHACSYSSRLEAQDSVIERLPVTVTCKLLHSAPAMR